MQEADLFCSTQNGFIIPYCMLSLIHWTCTTVANDRCVMVHACVTVCVCVGDISVTVPYLLQFKCVPFYSVWLGILILKQMKSTF